MSFRSILNLLSSVSLPLVVFVGLVASPAFADESDAAAKPAAEVAADGAEQQPSGEGETTASPQADESVAEADEDSKSEAADEATSGEADAEGEGGTAEAGEHHASDDAAGHVEDHDNAGTDHGDHGDGGGHGDEHGGGHETGVPGWKTDLALWSLVTFVCFLFVLKKAAWGPLISGLDKREAGIRAAIAEAEDNQRKSQAMLAEYEEKLRSAEQTVAEMVAEAKRDAERTSQDIVATAQADVEAMRERAKEDIAQAKDKALAEVFGSINYQVAAATERVLGRALSSDDQDRLIQEALTEISS